MDLRNPPRPRDHSLPTDDLSDQSVTKRVCVHGVVSGRVQGVGFRAFVRRTAEEFGVSGWVKNNYNGTVEFAAEGTREVLFGFVEAVRRGNRFSNVQSVEFDWEVASNKTTFDVLR
ncbi:MAG: acylphosphatase [bacterium]|nr:acylphosphatase [bacterium]